MYKNQILKKNIFSKTPTSPLSFLCCVFWLNCDKGGLCLKGRYLQGNRISISFLFYFGFGSWKELPSKLQQINMVEVTVPREFNVMQNICKQVLHNILLRMGWFCS